MAGEAADRSSELLFGPPVPRYLVGADVASSAMRRLVAQNAEFDAALALRVQAEESHGSREALLRRLKMLETQVSAKETLLRQERESVASLRTVIDKLQRENAMHERQLIAIQTEQQEQLGSTAQEVEAVRLALDSVQREKTDLTKLLKYSASSVSTTLEEERARHASELASLREQHAEQLARAGQQGAAGGESASQFQAQYRKMSRDLLEASAEVKRLTAENRELRERLADSEGRCRELESELMHAEELEQRNRTALEALQARQTSADAEVIGQIVKSLDEQQEERSRVLSRQNSRVTATSSTGAHDDASALVRETQREQLALLQQRHANTAAEYESEISELRQRIQDLSDANEELADEAERLRAEAMTSVKASNPQRKTVYEDDEAAGDQAALYHVESNGAGGVRILAAASIFRDQHDSTPARAGSSRRSLTPAYSHRVAVRPLEPQRASPSPAAPWRPAGPVSSIAATST